MWIKMWVSQLNKRITSTKNLLYLDNSVQKVWIKVFLWRNLIISDPTKQIT